MKFCTLTISTRETVPVPVGDFWLEADEFSIILRPGGEGTAHLKSGAQDARWKWRVEDVSSLLQEEDKPSLTIKEAQLVIDECVFMDMKYWSDRDGNLCPTAMIAQSRGDRHPEKGRSAICNGVLADVMKACGSKSRAEYAFSSLRTIKARLRKWIKQQKKNGPHATT